MPEPIAKANYQFLPFDRSLLVLGGARSGKSRHAQAIAETIGGRLTFIATAQAFDAEMTDRIARHRADRDTRWETVEAPLDLGGAITTAGSNDGVVLVDCLTLWTSNLMLGNHNPDEALSALLTSIVSAQAKVILVANETGLGIVPDNALARQFRDLAGTINRRVASSASAVDFVLAGMPMRWKQTA